MPDNAVEFFTLQTIFLCGAGFSLFISTKIAYHNRLMEDMVTKTQPLFTKPLTEEIGKNMKHIFILIIFLRRQCKISLLF